MTRKHAFGELELAILNIVEASGRVTVGDVLEKLDGGNKYTTLMTVMSRLAEKGELEREKIGKSYEYWIKKKSFSLSKRIKDIIFRGSSFEMVSYLLDSSDDINDEDLKRIENMIRKKREAND